VANTGNVTLTGITVTEESFSGAGALPAPVFVSATAGSSEATLLVGGVLTYTATYAVEQADIDAGGVTNQARATGTDPNDEPVTDLSDDDSNLEDEPTETPIDQDPAIAIIKTGSYDAGTGEITYTFTVANTGNVTLTGIAVTEESFSGAGALPAPVFVSATAGSSEATLLVGGVLTYTATYAVEQADIDAGGVTNQARATGTDPNDEPVTDLSDDDSNLEDEPTETPIDQDPAIAIIKTGSYDAGTGEITYTFTVANTGNVTLTGIAVTEESFSGAGALPAPVFVSATAGSSEATLLVGGVLTYTATYAVEQADIDAGGVTNQARATGTDPNDEPVTDLSDDDSNLEDEPTETPIDQDPAIAIIKTGSYDAGTGEITYTFTVANTGNVTLTGITVTEETFSGAGALPAPVFVSGTAGSSEATLLVGGVLTYTATYTVEQADIDAGGVTNQARATGTDPNDEPVTDLSDDDSNLENEPTETPIDQDPAIAIIKTGSYDAGTGEITYTFTVANTGNVTLTGIAVTEETFSGAGALPAPVFVSGTAGSSEATLLVGGVLTYTATYAVEQADIDAGGVTNQARATGTDPNDEPVTDLSDDDSNLENEPTETPIGQDPAIAIIKTGYMTRARARSPIRSRWPTRAT
jgi:large repetitive protein